MGASGGRGERGICGCIGRNDDEITTLFVASSHVGQGIGRALYEEMECDFVLSTGKTLLRVLSTVTAADFYAHMGFREDPVVTERPSGGPLINSVQMSKTLR